jgi:sirohydrochlorin ferrochelatase
MTHRADGDRPALILIAHGSHDSRAADTLRGIRDLVAGELPGVDAHLGFLDHVEPHPLEVLATVRARSVVLVPLLLSAAFHVRVDIAAIADSARIEGRRVAVTDSLVPHPLLNAVVDDRLTAAGVEAGTPLVLAAAGTSSAEANADTEQAGLALARHRRSAVHVAYLTAAKPTVSQELSRLAVSAEGLAVVTWLLAPGHFAAAVGAAAAAAGVPYTEVLGAHPALARVLVERYNAAAKAS